MTVNNVVKESPMRNTFFLPNRTDRAFELRTPRIITNCPLILNRLKPTDATL